ncbi:MAG: WecB/TagA/CpsF family glycosyltransferase [Bradyrhizobium sp.]|nr:WecB/TagA/CpsF family glycosyltransferase [Bradyrhizobium sp.]
MRVNRSRSCSRDRRRCTSPARVDDACGLTLHATKLFRLPQRIARDHRHRCVALVRSVVVARRGKNFFGIQVPVATAMGTLFVFCACVPRPHCHQEIDMLDTQTRQHHNLTVDGVTINVLSLAEAVSSIVSAAQHGDNFSVCTLNLDHVVQLQQRADFRAAYRRARFVTADGFPIVVLSRLLGTRITRTTGADLVEPVCREARRKGLPIFMLGSNDRTLSLTAKRLSERFQGLKVAGYYAPGANFDPYSSEADFAIDSIRASGAKLCFVALGAPRQELFAARCLDELNGTGLLCIGAALDFIAGTQTRAPALTQKVGLEWAWRMLREPRRLGPRYARCLAIVPQLVVRSIPQIVNARMGKAA